MGLLREPEPNAEIFSPNWFCGVSVLNVPSEKAELLLNNSTRRSDALKRLVESIPSEMADPELQVGPRLDGDSQERDTERWEAGFDGPGCCVGLYSALQNKSPELNQTGMSRCHKDYYIVCKAGSGVAGQTFQGWSRLSRRARRSNRRFRKVEPLALRRSDALSRRPNATELAYCCALPKRLALGTMQAQAPTHIEWRYRTWIAASTPWCAMTETLRDPCINMLPVHATPTSLGE